MTSEQINILIKHGDICPVSSSHSDMSECTFTDTDQNIEYCISIKMYEIFERLFSEYLEFEVDFDHKVFIDAINNKSEFISPLKEDRITFYKDYLKEQNDELTSLLDEIYTVSIDTIDLAKSLWPIFLLKNGMYLIECLKFTVLKGKKLEAFSWGYSGTPRSKNHTYIKEFFYASSIKNLYTIVTIGENIRFLKSCILEIDESKNETTNNQKSKKVTHRDNAIAYIFKQNMPNSHFAVLTRIDSRNLLNEEGKPFGKNFEIALGNLTYFGKNKKTKYKPYNSKDLQRVIDLKLLDNYPEALKALKEELIKLIAKSS